VLLVDQQRQHVLAVISGGGEVNLEEVLDDFDAQLNAPIAAVDRARQALMDDLGVGRRYG